MSDRRREWTAVLGLAAAVVVVCAVWLALDRRPPEWDHANHLERALECASDLRAGDVAAMLERSSFYPPLVPCTAGLFMRVLGPSAVAAQLVVWAGLVLGAAATYAAGRALAGGHVGVLAAILFATAPFVVFSALRFQLDVPLAGLVALALVTLGRGDAFAGRGRALLTGVVCGLGMLTKPSFAVYVAPALAVSLAQTRRAGVALNVALAGAATTVLTLPWYGPRALGMLAQVGARSGKQAAESGHPETLSWAGVSFYPRWLVTEFGAVAVLLLLLGLAVAVRQRRGTLLASALVPLAAFMAIRNKNLRYILPIVPALGIVAALGFAALARRARVVAAVAVAAAAVLQVGGTVFGVPPAAAIPGLGAPWWLGSRPMRADWQHVAILDLLRRETRGAVATVSVVPNDNFFSVSNFRYYALRDGLPLRWTRAWDESPIGVDFMILKSGAQGPSWTAERPRRIAERLASDAYLARAFPVIGEFPLPDGSTATVRARRVPVHDGPPRAVSDAVERAVRAAVPDVARDVEGLVVTLAWDDAIARGRIRRLVVGARSATLGELRRRDVATLRVHDLRIVAHDVLVDPDAVAAGGRLEMLDVARIDVERATITGADLAAFLARLKQFRRTAITLEDGAAAVVLRQAGPDVRARVRFLPAANGPFAIAADDVRVGPVAVPTALVAWVMRNYDPAPRLAARLPVPVAIAPVTITPEAIRIGAAKEGGSR